MSGRCRLLAAAFLLALLLSIPASSEASTSTFLPTADSYVSAAKPSENFGTLTRLRVDGSPAVVSYLRFDVQGLSGTITSARLSLVPETGVTADIAAAPVADNSWDETGITFDNAPPAGATLDSTTSAGNANPVSLDVTSGVSGNGPVSLALSGLTTPGLALASREAAANVAPRLTVDTSTTTGGPTAPAAPTGLQATATQTSIALSWTASTGILGVAGYNVYDGSALVAQVPGTSYTFTGLSCGTSYTLGVEAYDTAGDVSPRTTLDASTSACTSTGSHVLAAAGDMCADTTCSEAGITAQTVRDIAPERFLGLGDFQYQNAGTNGATFQSGWQAKWGDLAAITIPTFGATHDTCDGSGAWECYPVSYFNASGAPEAVAKLYDHQWGYSFDIGAWHVVDFNYRTDLGGSVAAVTADLDAHPGQCLLAIDHAPVWGSPSSEHPTNEASDFAATLQAHGADLILNGHQHFYERNVVGGTTEITNGLGGVGHYTRTSVASSAVAYNDTSYGVVKLTLSGAGWATTFVPNQGAAALSDSASGTCG